MTPHALLAARLANHHLVRPTALTPAQLVAHFGAVQAQDYPAAKWALGVRSRTLTDRAVDDAFDRGEILRTHVLRPTWHFVTPVDIGWMLQLTGPRLCAR